MGSRNFLLWTLNHARKSKKVELGPWVLDSVRQDRMKLENSHWEARDGKYLQTHIFGKIVVNYSKTEEVINPDQSCRIQYL